MSSTSQLQDIYRQTVLDHSRNPRNFMRMEPADCQAEGHNPLCGDKITIYLQLTGEKIAKATFEGTGCAICIASASIMTELLTGKDTPFAEQEIDRIKQEFSMSNQPAQAVTGEMAALAGVRDYPSRIKCALLAWKTLSAALSNENAIVTTED
jgi:nitrogen fixation NifU-like protein